MITKVYKLKEYEILDAHPAANCLPWHLDKPEFAELIESVKVGFDENKPVIVQQGTNLIISGRRRALACEIAGTEAKCQYVEWTDQQIHDWVKRDEIIRRNLTPGERAAALVALANLREVGENQHKNKGKEGASAVAPSSQTKQQLADESQVSKKTIERLALIKKQAPELMPLVSEGKLEVNLAARCAKELTSERRRKIINADDPKKKAKELLKASKPAPDTSNPNRGGNNFDYGANAKPGGGEQEAAPPDGPDPMTDADAFVGEMESICRDIDQYLKRIRKLEKSKYAPCVMLSTAISQIEAARKQLWVNRPSHECSYCDGKDKNCRACKGTFRLSKAAHERGRAANGEAA